MLNTFKTLVTDEEMLDKDDMWILDKMREFAQNPEALSNPAAKQLIVIIDRVSLELPISDWQRLSSYLFSNNMVRVLSRPHR